MRVRDVDNGVLYLSGGMEKAAGLGAEWREQCAVRLEALGYRALDITALDRAYAATHGELYHSFGSVENHLLQVKSNIRTHFVYADLELITHVSDAIILFYDESVRLGAGTISEAQVAYNVDKPIFIVNGFDTVNELPGWLVALSTKIFSSFDDLFNYLSTLPQGILRRDKYGNRRSGTHYLCSLCGVAEEKHKSHFVSKVSPMYCKMCVELVKTTFEQHADRYQFFLEHLEQEAERERQE